MAREGPARRKRHRERRGGSPEVAPAAGRVGLFGEPCSSWKRLRLQPVKCV